MAIKHHTMRLVSEAKDLREALRLKNGGGGGTYDGMETRVTKLETHFEYIRRDLDEVKAGQTRVIEKLDQIAEKFNARLEATGGHIEALSKTVKDLPNKEDLRQWKWQWAGIMVAIFVLTVTAIVGGLSWLKPDPAPAQPTPVVVYQPAAPSPVATAPTPPQQ